VASASDAGLPTAPSRLRGGDAAYNAAALQALLDGQPGPYRDAVLFNAAAALMVAGEVTDWHEGVEEAAEAIDKGLAMACCADRRRSNPPISAFPIRPTLMTDKLTEICATTARKSPPQAAARSPIWPPAPPRRRRRAGSRPPCARAPPMALP
jgi:hypothetical protein